MNTEITRYIPDQLLNFITSRRCCQQFCGSFRSPERVFFAEFAEGLGFATRNYIQNGIETMKVYKRNCTHFVEAEHLVIQRQSAKELFLLFHTHLQNVFIGRLQEMHISPDYHSPRHRLCPSVAPVRFSQCSFIQAIATLSPINLMSLKNFESLRPYKEAVLYSIQNNRLLVVNGSFQFEKSTMLPMFLLENCAQKHLHCKIICVELSNMLASYNSELLAKNIGEKVGERIACQIYGHSLISSSSNVIYTTAPYFLRFLMGQKAVDNLLHVSHILVNDVHIRNPYVDLLLSELRSALLCHPELRIMLLSNSRENSIFLKYFDGGEELQLDSKITFEGSIVKLPQIFYIEEIRQVVSEKCPKPLAETNTPSVMREFDCKYLDRCLEHYEKKGTDSAFDSFLYLVFGEFASLNYRHSVTGCTALIIAAKLGKTEHVKVLLQYHADPYITDEQNHIALQKAIASEHSECVDLLSAYNRTSKESYIDADPASFDSALISDLICLITTYPAWSDGNILIFVPNYEQLVRMNFSILRLKVIGKLPQQIAVRVLHENLKKDEVYDLVECTSKGTNIIITTDIGDIFPHLKAIKYVIDSARTSCVMYNALADCNDHKFKWNSQESIDNRAMIINQDTGNGGICFRLLPRSLYSQLPSVNIPDMLTMPLDRICLTVKLLSPDTMIAEYLQRTITKPPFIHVHQTVENLKKIDVLNYLEDITWLGCRLIDLPIECHLGKLLIFGIMLHCFDPIVTIASFLSQRDPLNLPKETECAKKNHVNTIRYKVKEERSRLAENFFSDHLTYLRLYDQWQNSLSEDVIETPLTDEHDFVVKALLENVCLTRSNLVVALRAAQLICNQGPLNMFSLNMNSNNWPIIKAALVGSLYPKICVVDASVYRIKSGRSKELVIYPSSVLRDLAVEPLNESVQKFSSPWIVYSNELNSVTCNSLETCTLIAPLAIIMFAGTSKICSENVTTYKASENFPRGADKVSLTADSLVSNFYIDEWIWFSMDATDAQLLLKTRQLFYSIYFNYLQNCINMEKIRNSNPIIKQLPRLLESLAKVFLHEDIAYGFTQPEHIGERPRAKQVQFLHTHNITFGSANKLLRTELLPKVIEKQYYIVYCPECVDANFGKSTLEWLHTAVSKIIASQLSTDSLTYVITYQRSPDQFRSVCQAFLELDKLKLRECFRNNIPIFELINICLTHNIHLPSFNGSHMPFRIENQVGEIVLDLFAYRYICFYNY